MGHVAYIHQLDIVCLTETRCTTWDDNNLPGYSTAFIPASEQGRAGEGITVAVKTNSSYHVADWASSEGCLWVKIIGRALTTPLLLGCCYIPPLGSSQLRAVDIEARFARLTTDVSAACSEGHVLLTGDFNARVGELDDSNGEGSQRRGCTDTTVNAHGRRLVEMCKDTGLLLCTGRAKGDEHAIPTFWSSARGTASRLDHLLVSPDALPLIQECGVRKGRSDSDHCPLESIISLPLSEQNTSTCTGPSLRRIHWDPKKQNAYVQGLETVGKEYLDSSKAAMAHGNVGDALDALRAGMCASAESGGMYVSSGLVRPTRLRPPHKAFFDHECKALKRQVRLARLRGDSGWKDLERHYHGVVRAKKRAFQRGNISNLIRERAREPRKFWKRWHDTQRPIPEPLMQVQLWDEYLEKVAGTEGSGTEGLSTQAYPQQPSAPAERLNCPITLGEVLFAMRNLHNGRATGFQGYPAELLRAAQPENERGEPPKPHLLAPLVAEVLNGCFGLGEVPAEVNVSVITPVYKKGHPLDTGNYRPIAVTEPLMRLYASILNKRIVDFTEDKNLRAASQAGFRPGLSCTHHIFALQHMIDHAHLEKQPLYVCFLDLKGAYDNVPRPLLWEVLQRLGIHGEMLGAIQSLYSNCTVTMKVGGRCGPRLPSRVGVKQGCPLSPTLFGLFMDGLHRHLHSVCPDGGHVMRNGERVIDLEYADDVLLVSDSPQGLQIVLDGMGQWSDSVRMTVSGPKTKAVVFGKLVSAAQPHVWVCQGQHIEQVTSFPYLGTTFQSPSGIEHTFPKLQKQQLAAWARLMRQYGKLDCGVSVGLLLAAFSVLVVPTASYGCEVWAFRKLHNDQKKACDKLELRFVSCLRQITGVRATTSTAILFRELGVSPLRHMWLKQGFTFWNNVAALPRDHPCHQMALDSCYDATKGTVNNWATAVTRHLRDIGYQFVSSSDRMSPVDMDRVRFLLGMQSSKTWEGLDVCPRTCPSKNAQLCTYERWFARPLGLSKENLYLTLPVGGRRLRMFLRFRMGCHGLPNDAGRQRKVPRHQRLCQRCALGEVGDEQHLIFACPAVQTVRTKYSWLFRSAHMSMIDFMWQVDKLSVVKFVTECLELYLTDN